MTTVHPFSHNLASKQTKHTLPKEIPGRLSRAR